MGITFSTNRPPNSVIDMSQSDLDGGGTPSFADMNTTNMNAQNGAMTALVMWLWGGLQTVSTGWQTTTGNAEVTFGIDTVVHRTHSRGGSPKDGVPYYIRGMWEDLYWAAIGSQRPVDGENGYGLLRKITKALDDRRLWKVIGGLVIVMNAPQHYPKSPMGSDVTGADYLESVLVKSKTTNCPTLADGGLNPMGQKMSAERIYSRVGDLVDVEYRVSKKAAQLLNISSGIHTLGEIIEAMTDVIETSQFGDDGDAVDEGGNNLAFFDDSEE